MLAQHGAVIIPNYCFLSRETFPRAKPRSTATCARPSQFVEELSWGFFRPMRKVPRIRVD